jgi:prolipoprotein diacylglyceryltransferase
MFSVVIYKSIQRGYHLRSVLLMLTTITLFTVIGTRLFTIPIEDWFTAINTKSPEFNNRSSIGGLLFGLVGLIISQRIFGFKRPMLDLFAWLAPIALGITKLGCLFNGCCYGLPFNGFWGIQYPESTHAHFNHWFSGSVEKDAILSLSVHPVQLYETLTLFIIGYIVWKTHKKWNKNMSAMLFALCLYFSLRFGVEYFRDHSVSQFSTTYYLGIWSYQWGMLGLGLLLGVFLWIYEKRVRIEISTGRQNSPYIHAEFIYIVILSFVIYTFTNLLLPFELKAVWIMFIPAIILSFYYLFTETRLRNHRKIVGLLLLAPFYVLAQTIPDEAPKIKQYKRIDVGGAFGNFVNEVTFNPQQTQNECGTTTSYSHEYFKQVYQMAGAGYSQVTIKNNKMQTYGINVSGGNIKSTNLSSNESQSEFIYAINPYAKWDGKWIGAGLGLQVGKLRVNKDETIDAVNIEDALKNYSILPEFYLRIGPKKYFDIDYNYGSLMPSAFPTLYSRSSIGSGFGLSQDYSLRYGRIWNLETNYIAAEALITDQWGVNIMYVFKENYPFQTEDASGKLVLSLNYRFGNKTK